MLAERARELTEVSIPHVYSLHHQNETYTQLHNAFQVISKSLFRYSLKIRVDAEHRALSTLTQINASGRVGYVYILC